MRYSDGKTHEHEALCKGCGLLRESLSEKILHISKGKTQAKGYHPGER